MKIGCPILKLKRAGAPAKQGKSGSISALLKEMYETRYTKSQTYDESMSMYNKYVYPPGCSNVDEAIAYLEGLYETAWKANHGDKQMRKDRVLGFTGIIKPPAENLSKMSFEEQEEFLTTALEGYKKICRDHNLEIDGWAYHRDEEGDHIHVFGHSKSFDVHDFSDLPFKAALNRELPEYMRSHGYQDVEDCINTDRTRKPHGRSVNAYRRDKIKEQTEQLEKEFQEGVQKAELQSELYRTVESDIQDLKAEKVKLQAELQKASEKLSEALKDTQRITAAVNGLRGAMDALQAAQKAYQAELAEVQNQRAFEERQRELQRQAEEARKEALRMRRQGEACFEDILEKWERNNRDRNMSL